MKICKICNKTEELVLFYKSDKSICTICRSEKEKKQRCEKLEKFILLKYL